MPLHRPVDPSTPPHLIPLPASPIVGPSRLLGSLHDSSKAADLSFEGSINGEADEVDEGHTPDDEDDNRSSAGSKKSAGQSSSGWSIFPDEGYLPSSVFSSKKKKKKSKPSALPSSDPSPIKNQLLLPPGARASLLVTSDTKANEGGPCAANGSRTAEDGMSAEETQEEQAKMIDTLRAEIGVARAEEGKAREDAARARAMEDRLRIELERTRRGSHSSSKARGEGDSRRRENEVSD